jgi:phospholipid/cholesterol/gamma-HCH transport system substrate-binding protein
MSRTTLDLWVGAFVVAGIAAILFLALKVGNLGAFDASQAYQLKAEFDNIGGLKVRAPVKSAGVVVGRVADIRFDNVTYEALVTLNITDRYKFPKDSSAAIMTSGLLGEQYIALEAGGDPKMLSNGDKIKLTQGAVILENLIGQFLYGKAGEGAQDKPSQ